MITDNSSSAREKREELGGGVMEGKRRGQEVSLGTVSSEQRRSQCHLQRESLEMSPEAQVLIGFPLEARHVLWDDKALV